MSPNPGNCRVPGVVQTLAATWTGWLQVVAFEAAITSAP